MTNAEKPVEPATDIELGIGMRATLHSLASTRLRGSRDLRVPSAWELTVDLPDLPYVVRLEVVAAGTGKPDCKSITCEQRAGGTPVATAGLRRIPVDRLVTESIVGLGLLSRAEAQPNGTFLIRRAEADEVVAALRRARRVRLTPDHLQEVAAVYRSGGSAPTKAVEAYWGAEPRTATRWVSEARRGGYLEPLTRTQSSDKREDER